MERLLEASGERYHTHREQSHEVGDRDCAQKDTRSVNKEHEDRILSMHVTPLLHKTRLYSFGSKVINATARTINICTGISES